MRSITPLLVLALGAASCSSGTAGKNGEIASPEYAIAISPSSVIQVSVDGSRVYGPNVMLERHDGALRGRGPTGVVDLRKDGETLRGIVGTGPTELHLEPMAEGGFVLRGMYGGALGRLDVRPDRIEGQLGRCQYNLRLSPIDVGVAYNGRRICGRYFEPATITLSPTIAALEPLERSAIIAILLGS